MRFRVIQEERKIRKRLQDKNVQKYGKRKGNKQALNMALAEKNTSSCMLSIFSAIINLK